MELNNSKEAAVLVLHELTTDSLILTQRSPGLRAHPGEICFPGGSWEEGDDNLLDTALRELEEELGISPSRVQLPRRMAVELTLTGYIIHPWFASIESLTPYQTDNREVSEVFTLPMSEVSDAANYGEIEVHRLGRRIKTCQYLTNSRFVWGATARIMRQLTSAKGLFIYNLDK